MNLQDTLSNSEQELDISKKIKIYLCGVTVYDESHIGHARTIIVFDVLRKYLESKKVEVEFIQNFTDVDDKIIKRATTENVSVEENSNRYIKNYFRDFDGLNVKRATNYPKATEHIDLMIEMISELINKSFAYENNNHVYFEVKKFDDYGQLSNKKLDELIAGSRIEVSDNKKNSEDFVLWKPSLESEPSWDSPWGKGRPGWHLECSAMSKKFLGNEFDIHGGGIDLIFPHHENEIAQSRCANDSKFFAKYWVHNAFITMSNEKMAKSQGNILKIKDFRNKISGQVLRLALMSAHYKQPLDWNDKLINNCQNTLDKWYRVYSPDIKSVQITEEVLKPLYEDLNTPGFIANLHKLYESANKGEDKELFISACKFVGLLNEDN